MKGKYKKNRWNGSQNDEQHVKNMSKHGKLISRKNVSWKNYFDQKCSSYFVLGGSTDLKPPFSRGFHHPHPHRVLWVWNSNQLVLGYYIISIGYYCCWIFLTSQFEIIRRKIVFCSNFNETWIKIRFKTY